MCDRWDTMKEEAKSVRERFGRRWIFGAMAAAVALGVGALAITMFGMRRRRAATEDAAGESYGTVGERFGEDRVEDQEAALPKEELVRRAQQISRGPARESHESERTDTASETEQEVSGGSARGESHESEQTDTASETEQEVRRYLKDIEYPASKDDLVSAARSNDAPQELIQKLVDLSIKEYSNPEEVAVAVDSLGGARGG
jgi:cytoskeletal protein RodZ